jgi:hypothetical protein
MESDVPYGTYIPACAPEHDEGAMSFGMIGWSMVVGSRLSHVATGNNHGYTALQKHESSHEGITFMSSRLVVVISDLFIGMDLWKEVYDLLPHMKSTRNNAHSYAL